MCGCMCVMHVQGFRTKEEVQRFADLMEEMCTIVATKHSGEWRQGEQQKQQQQ